MLAENQTTTIVSFNIRYGTANDGGNKWDRRKELLIRTLQNLSADVVCLQEALQFQIDYVLSQMPMYQAITRGREASGDGEHSTILYNASIMTPRHHGTFWLSEEPETPGSVGWGASLPRICTWAHFFQWATGRAFYCFNTHMDHASSRARLESAHLLVDRIRGRQYRYDPVVLCGDLNATERTAPIMFLQDNLRDVLRESHGPNANLGSFHDFGRQTKPARYDYIFVVNGEKSDVLVRAAEVKDVHIGTFYPSDHHPLMARLQFKFFFPAG
ncbi:endo/exonuclease/phosphatase domain-containing protein [Carpediemonas membranifera]|uniref:Endo/exonuclease/phosphatase domain-containing protein n=1 Tax=Carpediemonas membranifera TaxID=201153 RepID=A0A8J6E0S8_9EUKA|nr:endo/exonuclease/phosphatase domain-containing protein [Carpediemonas membranifera]|eukprot:KAG9389737.1 endo/exonuclease/phosphatase domain-containing protein [Carpediemonas membranifera]